MIPILVLKTENKVIYNQSNLNCKTFFEEFSISETVQNMHQIQIYIHCMTILPWGHMNSRTVDSRHSVTSPVYPFVSLLSCLFVFTALRCALCYSNGSDNTPLKSEHNSIIQFNSIQFNSIYWYQQARTPSKVWSTMCLIQFCIRILKHYLR